MPQLYTERYMSPKKLARTGRIETWDGKTGRSHRIGMWATTVWSAPWSKRLRPS